MWYGIQNFRKKEINWRIILSFELNYLTFLFVTNFFHVETIFFIITVRNCKFCYDLTEMCSETADLLIESGLAPTYISKAITANRVH